MLAVRVGILESLLPIFLLVALGYVLTRTGFFDPAFLRGLSALAYFVAMPGLLFLSVSRAPALDARPLHLAAIVVAASVAALLLGLASARMLRLPAGTFAHVGFRGNLAFVGLPVLGYFFSQPGAPAPAAEIVPLVAVVVAPVMIVYNILAIVVELAGDGPPSRVGWAGIVRSIATNPLVLGIVAGLVASRVGWRPPSALETTLEIIGATAVPAALFGVGGTIALAPFGIHLRGALFASLLKVGVAPLAGWAGARLAGFSPIDTALVVVLCATPTATVSFIMSTRLRGDPGLAATSIALSTMLSAFSLAAALALFP